MKTLGKVGVIGRWKPLHKGGAQLLETLCNEAEHVVIGIGSSNKYNARNPFTAEETRDMMEEFLAPRSSNHSYILLPDFAHMPEFRDGNRWKQYAASSYGQLDLFVSGNAYVLDLMKDVYAVRKCADIILPERWIPTKGSLVRLEMARGDYWKRMVSGEVSTYLESKGLVERFRHEFGLETIAQLSAKDCARPETIEEERGHMVEI